MTILKFGNLFLLSLPLLFFNPHLIAQQTQPSPFRLSAAHRQTDLPGLSQTWHRYWDKGYLIAYGSHGSTDASPDKPAITLYDQNGQVAREATVWFKDALSVGINDVSVNRTGNLVVAGGTQNESGVIANFIASIGADGRISQVIRTTPFLPIYLCAAEDGTVWSYGFDRDEEGKRVKTSLMLRQYSFEKGQIKAILDTSTLNPYGWTLSRGRYLGEINFRCNSQKVGLFNGVSSEYVEFDIPTNTLKVREVNPLPSPKEERITGFALTDSGEVFVSIHDRSSLPPRSGLFKLTFNSSDIGTWVPVENTIGPYLHGGPIERLLGVDGTDLIYTRDLSGTAFWADFTK